MLEKAEGGVSGDLQASTTMASSGVTKRKFAEVEQDSATGQQGAKVRKTEEGTAAMDDGPGWVCASCTFVNHPSLEACEMCDNSKYGVAMLQKQLEAIKQRTSVFDPPSSWQPVDPGTRVRLVKLAENDVNYVDINKMMSTCTCNDCSSFFGHVTNWFSSKVTPRYDIKKIERTENLYMYQMYSIKKEQMKQENGPLVENERRLWHGTSAECVNSIVSDGFNRSLCGKNGTNYGQGVYFSTRPCYSSLAKYAKPDKSNLQYMFYSRVLTGRYTPGSPNMVEPPKYWNGLGRFNSLVDKDNPTMFVIFHDAQVYPEFLITFTTL